jgi:hypothetical protein
MPAKPSYCHRLAAAIEALEKLPTEWVGRRQFEEALGVSKTVAWRVFRACGAQPGPGSALVCRRPELIARLRELQEQDGIIPHEIRRRERLEATLEHMRSYMQSRQRKVVRDEQAPALLSTRFAALPPNVTFTPTSLHIDFCGTEGFLQAIGAVVFALNNDYEAVSDFIERGAPASMSAR